VCRDKPNNPQVARPRTGYPISNYKPKKNSHSNAPQKNEEEKSGGHPFPEKETKDSKRDAARGSKKKRNRKKPKPTTNPCSYSPSSRASYSAAASLIILLSLQPLLIIFAHRHTRTLRNLACLGKPPTHMLSPPLFVLLCHMFLFLSLSPCCAGGGKRREGSGGRRLTVATPAVSNGDFL